MLIGGSQAMAGLPIADPLGRYIDQRLVGLQGWPVLRQAPDTIGQDADEDIFGWERAASVMPQPAQVAGNDAHRRLQRLQFAGSSDPATFGRALQECLE
jgi:hypothetical protein